MFKIYFKQAVGILRQNVFISLIAILGTALAIMMIMSIIVVDEVRNISIAPESNRDRTYYIEYQLEADTVKGNNTAGPVQYEVYRDYLADMPTPELMSAYTNRTFPIGKEGEKETLKSWVKATDAAYWKIMDFAFTEGKPFGQEEVLSGVKQAVISESLAKRLFKGEKVLGEDLTVNFIPYRIVGIVKDISPVFQVAFADVWIPLTSKESFMQSGCTVIMLLKNKDDYPKIKQEVREAEKKYEANIGANRTLTLRGPDPHKAASTFVQGFTDKELAKGISKQRRRQIAIILILLLVPAVNLSGLSLSRIKRRTAEIGVRKAFGAKRHTILIQVLLENLITSLLGGILGLCLSYFAVYQLKHWLLKIPSDSFIPAGAFVSWPVFLAVFIICILINFLSAGIPAWRASRMSIAKTINENDK